VNLIGSYNYALVALSVLIAMFASYAALDLAGRVTAAGGWTRAVWLLGGASAMGTGIWSMHYIGMLAFILPIPVAYHWPTVLLSLFAAILASLVALGVVSRQKMGGFRALAGSVLIGAGIASMHYIGMAAMRLPADCQYNSFLVVLSVVFAVLISLAALWITFHFRDEKTGIGWEKLAGAVVMGAAIPVMHYTGMAAASFTSSGMPVDMSHAVSISTLGTAGIAAVTFTVLGLALLTSRIDRRLATQTLEVQEEKLQQSEAYLAEAQRLSHTGSFGWKPSTGELTWSEETFRIFEIDRSTRPTSELVLQRVHPKDAALVRETIERASHYGKDFDFEHRLLMPNGSVKHVHIVAHAQIDESDELKFVGAVMDTTDSKRAEKKLRRSEEFLLDAQKLSHTGSWRHDIASGEVTVSPEVYRIHDIKPDDDPSNTEFFFSKFHPEDRNRVVDLFERSEIEKTDFQVDYRIVLPDGSIKHLHTIGRPILNDSGDLAEFVGTVMDVTERRQAEEALRSSEEQWRNAFENNPTMYFMLEASGGIRSVNPFGATQLGYTVDDLIGRSVLDLFHEADREAVQRYSASCLEKLGESLSWELRKVRKDGSVLWVRETARAILGPKNRPILLVACEDITRRKQGEEKLRQNEAYLQESQRLGHMGSWAYNVSSGELFASPELLRIFGRDPDQEKATTEMFRGNVHPEDRAYVDDTIDKAMREKTDFAIDHRIVLPDGSIKHVYSMAHRVFDDSNTLVEYIGTVMDVTERKRSEEVLRRAQADLAHINRVTTMGELTASLAHEVNQPIAAAVTNANTCLRWLARDQPDLQEAREAALRIVKDGTRAAEIITRVRLLFKKGSPERELVDVNEVVREMIVLLHGEATRYSISFRTELEADLPQVMGDRVQLQQVFMNLMLNSIDAMKGVDGAREVSIKSQRMENEHIQLSVSDTGVGLPLQEASQIFNAFFTTKPDGTGMGLPISRSIIESHGGRLWAGDNPPHGASFYVTLPTKGETRE
jgi:PAS domain S-box-containing protein